jgi:hypothetical protein
VASIAEMRRLVASVWQRAVKHWELRPGSVTEWFVGQMMEELMKVVETGPQKVYRQETTVKMVEQRFKTIVKSGFGKDAVTDEVADGWWVTFTDNLSAVKCETKPDCKPGDIAVCTWEFRPR